MRDARPPRERLRSALDSVGDGAWDWNVRTDELFASDRWYASLGYHRSDFGRVVDVWNELLHPEDVPIMQSAVQAHLRGRTLELDCECRMRARSGEYRWTAVRGRVIERDAGGEPVRMVGTNFDISLGKRVQLSPRRARGPLPLDREHGGLHHRGDRCRGAHPGVEPGGRAHLRLAARGRPGQELHGVVPAGGPTASRSAGRWSASCRAARTRRTSRTPSSTRDAAAGGDVLSGTPRRFATARGRRGPWSASVRTSPSGARRKRAREIALDERREALSRVRALSLALGPLHALRERTHGRRRLARARGPSRALGERDGLPGLRDRLSRRARRGPGRWLSRRVRRR